jgi:hypothetical protein
MTFLEFLLGVLTLLAGLFQAHNTSDDIREEIELLVNRCYDEGGTPRVERTTDGYTVDCLPSAPPPGPPLETTATFNGTEDDRQESEESTFDPWYAYVDDDGNVTFL